MNIPETLNRIYELLIEAFGPQHWWPGESRLEVIVGAILTQNTAWTNVEKAIANLRSADKLSAGAFHVMSRDELAELIRPAGYFNVKAKRLKNFFDWLFENHCGDADRLEDFDGEKLREMLLEVNGIGPETADSIVLYAFEKPVFVVDAYTCRIFFRHLLLEDGMNYEMVREFFESNLPSNAGFYNEYHALLVNLGKDFCRPKPRCENCPLRELPHEV